MKDHLNAIKNHLDAGFTLQSMIHPTQVEIRTHAQADPFSAKTAYWKRRLEVLLDVNMGRIKLEA